MIEQIDEKQALAAQAVVMVKWTPISDEGEWVKAWIMTQHHPGDPTETECELSWVARGEEMTLGGMKSRAEEAARSGSIPKICFVPPLQ